MRLLLGRLLTDLRNKACRHILGLFQGEPGARAWRHALSLPLYPGLSAQEQAHIVHAVRRVFA